jgi:hypothetical protein
MTPKSVLLLLFVGFFFGTKKLENFGEFFFFCLGKIEIYFYFLEKVAKISILFTKQTLASIPNNNP